MTYYRYERVPLRRRQQGGSADDQQQQQAPVDPEQQRQAELEQIVAMNAPPQRQIQPSPLSALARFEAMAPIYRSSSMLGAPILNPSAQALASEIASALPQAEGGAVDGDDDGDDDSNPGNISPEEQQELIRLWEAQTRVERGEGPSDGGGEYAEGGRVDDDDSADVRLAYVPIPRTGYPQGEPVRFEYQRPISPRDKKLYELMHQTGAHHYLSPKHAAVVFRDLLR